MKITISDKKECENVSGRNAFIIEELNKRNKFVYKNAYKEMVKVYKAYKKINFIVAKL